MIDILYQIVYNHNEVIKMTAKQLIEMACAYAGISKSELARRLEWSPALLNNRMNVGKFTLEEWEKIAQAAGAEATMTFTFPDGKQIK